MRARGFTLIELMIATVAAGVVVAGAFVLLTQVQRAVGRQNAANEVVGQARVAMEVIARDLRSAGDSLDLLPAHCLGAAAHPEAVGLCPALLDVHPWRIAIARHSWRDVDGDGTTFGRDDEPPLPGTAFTAVPENVVTYRFVPEGEIEELQGGLGGGRKAVRGRIERVVNPFGFAGEQPRVTVLLENVLLDDRMRTNPSDVDEADDRFDYALFTFRLLTRNGELEGSDAITRRATTNGQVYLTPPMGFFAPAAPAAYQAAAPWMPAYEQKIRGLRTDGTPSAKLLAASTADLNPNTPGSALRRMLDGNRVRAVRVAFKVIDGRERPEVRNGVDLDGDPTNGTAHVFAFETTVELKVLADLQGAF